jgi:serine protease Do
MEATPDSEEVMLMCKRTSLSVLGALSWFALLSFGGTALRAEQAEPEQLKLIKALSKAFVEIGRQVRPSVVLVTTVRKARMPFLPQYEWPPFGEEWLRKYMPKMRPERMPERQGTGSGVVVDAKGYVLTNNHVVQEADKVMIRFSEKDEVPVSVVGTDPKTDLAVLKIERDGLKAARLGDSDKLEVGEIVLAIGAPFGLDSSVTSGIVSAKGRSGLHLVDYENFIQTDAAINPGNSGGPLVNLDGEVVGINTAIVSQTGTSAGIGFAIPINMARKIMESLIKDGKVTRGFLGIRLQDLDKDLADQFGLRSTEGVLVAEVIEGSAAGKAGVQVQDVILKFDGVAIHDGNDLRNRVAESPVGKDKEIVVWRDGKEVALKVTLGEMTQEALSGSGGAAVTKEPGYGLSLQELTPELAESFGYERDSKGLVITDVEQDSPAAEAGLQPGDLILEVGRQPVKTLRDFQQVASKTDGRKGLLLRVKNARNGPRYLVLKKP